MVAATLEACEARNLGALASKAPESRLLFAPYEHTLYSNLGYALLGQACARAAGVAPDLVEAARLFRWPDAGSESAGSGSGSGSGSGFSLSSSLRN